MTHSELQELKNRNKAEIIDTAEYGCVQLWKTDEGIYYTVLSDNTIIEGKDEDFFN